MLKLCTTIFIVTLNGKNKTVWVTMYSMFYLSPLQVTVKSK